MKNSIIVLLVAMALLMAACGQGTTGRSATGAGGTAYSAPGVFPITQEKVTLTALCLAPVNASYTVDMSTNQFSLWYEEKTNVNIDWEISIGANAENLQRLQLKIISGDFPDIFLQTPIDRNLLFEIGQEGILIPLNDLIDQHAPELSSIFRENPRERELVTTPDGNIYGLGFITDYYHGTAPNKIWAYRPWMEALNIPVPTTTQGYFDMLMSFRNANFNTGGQRIIPLMNISFSAMVSSFIYFDASNVMIDSNNQIRFVSDSEEYREALRWIHNMYRNGLLPQDVFSMEITQQRNLAVMNPVIVGSFQGMNPGQWYSNMTLDSSLFDYVAIPPLRGPAGVQQTPLRNLITNPQRFAITKNCAIPEVAIKWVDFLYSWDGTNWSNYGPELQIGVTDQQGWFVPPMGAEGVNGEQATLGIVTIPQTHQNYIANSRWAKQIAPWYQPIRDHSTMLFDPLLPNGQYERMLYNATLLYEPFKQDRSVEVNGTPIFFMTPENNPRVIELKNAINQYVSQAQAEFIVGVRNLDTDWSRYLVDLESYGLREYANLYNQEYQAYLARRR